jgi:iron(III) transport system ATP-binding protein
MFDNFLEIHNTTFVASKLNKVLDFNLTIKNEGDIICLLGPSGIGKTTILRSIAGLQKIPKGLISLKGKTLSSKNEHIEPEKRNIALSFQDNSLFPHYTILDNINFGSKRNRNSKYNFKAKELIELLHLQGLENKFPHQVSAGEAQRVSLARSLMSKPDLLLLDEPFSNIDESLKVELQLNIKKILKKKQDNYNNGNARLIRSILYG